ncbi:MAG: biotin/lipoyl-binding protein [Gloeomargaritaceae cyanobacterium C42_A2020_066]|nr:biotin/lipoyl-binding protein [Gloeomargaritaceae cyanobacterium C42_A2020_066]
MEIREEIFRLRDYQEFLDANAQSIAEFRNQQQSAFTAEREHWVRAGEFGRQEELSTESTSVSLEIEITANQTTVTSDVSGTVWQILVEIGQRVEEGQNVLILEAMKMEISVAAPVSGQIAQVTCATGDLVTAGQVLVILEAA